MQTQPLQLPILQTLRSNDILLFRENGSPQGATHQPDTIREQALVSKRQSQHQTMIQDDPKKNSAKRGGGAAVEAPARQTEEVKSTQDMVKQVKR